MCVDSQLPQGARRAWAPAAFATSLFPEPHPRLRLRNRLLFASFSLWSRAGDALSFPRPSRRCCVGGAQGAGRELRLPPELSGDPRCGRGRRAGVCRDNGVSVVSRGESACCLDTSHKRVPPAACCRPALWTTQFASCSIRVL